MPSYRDTLISLRGALIAQERAVAACEHDSASPDGRRHLAAARASIAAAQQRITDALRAPPAPVIEHRPRFTAPPARPLAGTGR